MFTKSLVSQALIDATKAIMEEDEKKQMLLEPGKKMELETGFHMAAHAAKKANQSHFEFQGKKYPVTAKSHTEGMVAPELIGGQIYKKRDNKAAASGHSADVREEEKKFDPLKHIKSPTPGEKAAAKDVKRGSYADRAAMLRSAQADGRLKEEKDDDSMYTTKSQAKKIADKEINKHEKHLHKGAKETKFDEERHMSDDEMAKREKNVKSMKKGMAGFKERYGKNARNVMYATATKQAMEEVEELDEENPLQNRAPTYRSKNVKTGKPIFHSTLLKQQIKNSLGKHVKPNLPEEFELDEAINDNLHPAGAALLKHIKPQHHNLYKPHLTTDVFNGSYKDRTDVLKAAKQAGHLKEEVDLDEDNTESKKEFMDRQKRLAAAGAQTAKDPARLKRMMNIPGYSAAMDLAKKTTTKKEDIGGISTMSEEEKSVRIEPNEDMDSKTVDTLKGRVKVPAEYHNELLSYKVKLNVEEKEKTTPMELAKELARKSFKKMRTEVMGKTGTSEEKKHD
jgi:hypothetical protein